LNGPAHETLATDFSKTSLNLKSHPND
jgi:hypothetical protein